MHAPCRRNKPDEVPRRLVSGFTLIELLVVVAIISLIAAILFPVFASAREKARQISCGSNMREIGTAVVMYIQDNDELYPEEHPGCADPAVGSNGAGDYDGSLENTDYGSPLEKLSPYIAKENANQTSAITQGLFVCPDDPDPHGALIVPSCVDITSATYNPTETYNPPWPGVTSYLINAYFLFGLSESQVTVPASTIFIAERNNAFCDVHVHPWLGEVFDAPTDTVKVDGDTPMPACIASNPADDGEFAISRDRHSKGANYAFADGHMKWETYTATIQTSTDQPCFGQYQALPAMPSP